jgi:hypothetical protein
MTNTQRGVIVIARSASTTEPSRRPVWLRRLAFAVGCLLTCLLFGWLGIQAAYPFVLAERLRADNDEIEREVHRYRLQNQRIQKDVKALETREGVIGAARKLGWVLPGETRLHITSPPPAPKP